MRDSYITNVVCPCWSWLESELVTLPNVNSREDVYSSLIEAALVPGGQATADVSTNCQEVRKFKKLIKSPLFTLMVLLNDQKWPNSGQIWAKFGLLDLSSQLDCLTFIQNLQYDKRYIFICRLLYTIMDVFAWKGIRSVTLCLLNYLWSWCFQIGSCHIGCNQRCRTGGCPQFLHQETLAWHGPNRQKAQLKLQKSAVSLCAT